MASSNNTFEVRRANGAWSARATHEGFSFRAAPGKGFPRKSGEKGFAEAKAVFDAGPARNPI